MSVIKERIKRNKAFIVPLKIYRFVHKVFTYFRAYICNFLRYRINPTIRTLLGKKDTQLIKKYQNKHKGERVFIIASGPSLRKEDVMVLKNEYTIAVNSTITLCREINWKPTYYCIGDAEVFLRCREYIINAEFIECFADINLKKYLKNSSFIPCYFETRHNGVAYLEKSKRVKKHTRFIMDAYSKGIYTARSITYSAIELAAFMGFSEIYIYGVDNSYDKNKAHFSKEGNVDDENNRVNVIFQKKFCEDNEISYEIAEKFSRKHGFRIFNATRGGAVRAFERIDLENIPGIIKGVQ